MVKPDLVVRKISRAKSWLDDAEEILSRPAEESGKFLTRLERRSTCSPNMERSTMTSRLCCGAL
jgi:hypothetical protein